jgi:hypothetical protein
MQTTTVTPEQLLELAADMPHDQLAQWYAYGLAMRSVTVSQAEREAQEEAAMWAEFAMWEKASDEDWLKFEAEMAKEA